MPPSLDDIPDLCLLAIFQYLSLLELLRTIRLVNTRWSRLLPTELNRRRSLVIVDDRHFDLSQLQLDQYQSRLIENVRRDDGRTPWTRLPQIDTLNLLNRNYRYQNDAELHYQVQPEMITTLVDSLPRITNLTVVQRFAEPSSLDQVIRLIDNWSNNGLVTLKLFVTQEIGFWLIDGNRIPEDFYDQMNAQIVKLFDSLNRATSLKHLKLDLKLFREENINLPELTILPQLSAFHSGYLFGNELDRALRHNVSGNQQIQITTGSTYNLDLLLRIDEKICAKFVDVQVGNDLTVRDEDNDDNEDNEDGGQLNRNLRDMNHLCTRFTSMSHLSLRLGNISMRILSRSLSRLTQLVHLSLWLFDRFGIDDEQNPADQNIITVASVRLITLELFPNSHNSTERLYLPEMFPNLQVLSITNNTESCSDCQYDTKDGTDEIAAQMRLCAQLVRAPFRRCPVLHTIEIDANDSYYLSEGMTRRLITRDEL